jgi:hypothetical protein
MSETTGKTFHFAALGLTLILSPAAQAGLAKASTSEERVQALGEMVTRGEARLVRYASNSPVSTNLLQDFDRDFDRAFEKAFDKDMPAAS